MKVLMDVKGEGLESLLGKKVLIMCVNYFYSGILSGVNEKCLKLDDAGIVYETGEFDSTTFKDFQKIKSPVYVNLSAIESFHETYKS